MGASFSTWARWDDAVVQQALTGKPPIQPSGLSLIHGARNLTINGGVFKLKNQVYHPQDLSRLRDMLDFLSLVNFRSIQSENLAKWTPGTVQRFLESSIFQFWLDSECAILWGNWYAWRRKDDPRFCCYQASAKSG
ncbi:hypothetical protein BKA70DRAFT_1580605 [Coprinopsis sp. MPI-PUGE-AT-0042]|nr:hypothetical protein BKA70DRAFT_1580605 [Coprinopsis sp. MPI-PUGE-AT-0042]